jgi:hypothetical protein
MENEDIIYLSLLCDALFFPYQEMSIHNLVYHPLARITLLTLVSVLLMRSLTAS